jgi:iron complex outermembrane receptor protein
MILENIINPSRLRYTIRTAFVASLLSGSALAQVPANGVQIVDNAPTSSTAPAPSAATASSTATDQSNAGLQEVIVTAQRRNEHLQDVPISVSAFSGPALEKQEVHSLQDLSARVPGFVSTGTVGYGSATLSIRGVGGSNGGGNFFADEPVATYIDGVYVGRLSVTTNDIVDLDSVQILRGPQGTLYGRNSTAGALLIATKRPSQEYGGDIKAGVDSLGAYRTEGAVSIPIVEDKVLSRIAAAYADHGSWGKNITTGEAANTGHDFTVRGSVRFLPTDSITVDVIGEHFEQSLAPALFRIAQVTGGLHDSPFVIRPDFQQAINNNQYAWNDPIYNNTTTNSATVLAEWRGDYFNINSISGFRSFDLNGRTDSVNAAPSELTGGALTSYNSAVLRNRQLTQELRISSPADEEKLTWTGGLFYIHENNEVNPFLISNSVGYFNLGTNSFFTAFQKLNAAAAFGDASYELLDGLTLRAGARYSFEEKQFNVNQRVVTINSGFSPATRTVVPVGFGVSLPPTYFSSARFYNFSTRAVLDYKIYKDLMAYFNFSQGFKSGGFNAFGLNPAFQPEKNNAYEIGIKSEFLEHTLRFNADAFMYDYSNLQVRLPVPSGGVNIANVGAASVRGGEVETTYTPLPDLTLGLNTAYLNATFTQGALPEVPPNATLQFGANIPLVTTSIVGNSLSRAPKWQINLTADYDIHIVDTLKTTVGMAWRYSTNEFYLETNQDSQTYRSGDWSELALHATVTSEDDRWSVTAFGENILDDRHVTQILSLRAFPYGALNEPARGGVRGTFKF